MTLPHNNLDHLPGAQTLGDQQPPNPALRITFDKEALKDLFQESFQHDRASQTLGPAKGLMKDFLKDLLDCDGKLRERSIVAFIQSEEFLQATHDERVYQLTSKITKLSRRLFDKASQTTHRYGTALTGALDPVISTIVTTVVATMQDYNQPAEMAASVNQAVLQNAAETAQPIESLEAIVVYYLDKAELTGLDAIPWLSLIKYFQENPDQVLGLSLPDTSHEQLSLDSLDKLGLLWEILESKALPKEFDLQLINEHCPGNDFFTAAHLEEYNDLLKRDKAFCDGEWSLQVLTTRLESIFNREADEDSPKLEIAIQLWHAMHTTNGAAPVVLTEVTLGQVLDSVPATWENTTGEQEDAGEHPVPPVAPSSQPSNPDNLEDGDVDDVPPTIDAEALLNGLVDASLKMIGPGFIDLIQAVNLENFNPADLEQLLSHVEVLEKSSDIPERLLTMAAMYKLLEANQNVLVGAFNDPNNVTFFPTDTVYRPGVLGEPSNNDEEGALDSGFKTEARNEWFQNWLTQQGYNWCNFKESNPPNSGLRKVPFTMYHVTDGGGNKFLALICDQVGISNCYIDLRSINLSAACALAQESRNSIYHLADVCFVTNHPGGEEGFLKRLEQLDDLVDFFRKENFVDLVPTHKNSTEYFLNLDGLDRSLSLEELIKIYEGLKGTYPGLYHLATTLIASQQANPKTYPQELLIHQLYKLLTRSKGNGYIETTNLNETLAKLIFISSFCPEFAASITYTPNDVRLLTQELHRLNLLRSKDTLDHVRLHFGKLFLEAYNIQDTHRAAYYYAKLSLINELVEFLTQNRTEKISKHNLLKLALDPNILELPAEIYEGIEHTPTQRPALTGMLDFHESEQLDSLLEKVKAYITVLQSQIAEGQPQFKSLLLGILAEYLEKFTDLLTPELLEENNTPSTYELLSKIFAPIIAEASPVVAGNNYADLLRSTAHSLRSMSLTESGPVHNAPIAPNYPDNGVVPYHVDIEPLLATTIEAQQPATAVVDLESLNLSLQPQSVAFNVAKALYALGHYDILAELENLCNDSGTVSIAGAQRGQVEAFIHEKLFGVLAKVTNELAAQQPA